MEEDRRRRGRGKGCKEEGEVGATLQLTVRTPVQMPHVLQAVQHGPCVAFFPRACGTAHTRKRNEEEPPKPPHAEVGDRLAQAGRRRPRRGGGSRLVGLGGRGSRGGSRSSAEEAAAALLRNTSSHVLLVVCLYSQEGTGFLEFAREGGGTSRLESRQKT